MYTKNSPHIADAKAGQTLYICRCGKTKTPPFCDGSHGESGVTPLAHTPDKDGPIYVCGCGKTGNNPFCDGAHSK
jgi:CDGSH-type Zn-finger protein